MATSKRRNAARGKRKDSSREARDEQSRELEALYRIAECVGSQRSSGEKLTAILEVVREVCGATSTRLAAPDDTENGVHTVARAGHRTSGEGRQRTIKAVFESGEPKVIDGPGSTGYFSEAARAGGVASRATLPIVLNGRVTHVLTVNAGTVGFFTPERMRFLGGITGSLGPLLENIRLQETERAQSRKIDALYRITESLANESLEDGTRAALESVRDLVGLRGCALWVPDLESGMLHRFAEAHVEGPRVAARVIDLHERTTTGRAYVSEEPVIENDYPPSSHAKRSGKKNRTKAAASFPVMEQGQVVAVVTYSSDRTHAFDGPTLALLRATTEALGTSFGRRRLEQIERRQTEALQALHSIARALAEPGAFADQVTVVLEEVKAVLEVDSADLRMPDAEDAGLRVVASVGYAQQPLGAFRAYGDSRTGRAFQQGKPIIAHDYEVNHRGGKDRGRRYRSGYVAQSVAWLPVKAAGRTVGVLAVDTAKRNHFTTERMRLLTTIADEIGTFIENAKLRETELLHLQELEVLNRTATIFAGGGTFEEKAKDVLGAIIALTGDWATLRVPDESGERLSMVASTWPGTIDVIEVSASIAGEAFSSGKPVVVNDYAADPRALPNAIDHGARSRAAFPIVVDELPRAVLVVSSQLHSYFTPERVTLLATIAAGIAPSIEKARASDRLQVAQQQLVQSGKLAAIGELAAGVAHEINNPLNNVMGFAQLLMDQDLPQEALADLEKIYAEGQRAARIVQHLLAFARNSEPERRSVDVRAVIERACSLKAYDLRRRSIELRIHLLEAPPLVSGDDQRLIEVVLNLLTNAEQAIVEGGRKGTVTVRCEADDDRIRISVSDDGPGIPPEILGRIFEPFFTTKEVGAGTGLGLSICQGIVRQHQGELWAESDLGAGATFHVELPVLAGPPMRAASPVEERPPASPLHILVVDDEPNARDLMAGILMGDGHAVDTASDGTDAASQLRETSYDCVVTDMRMPGMGGQELYQLTEQIIPELAGRFIFVTGDTMSPETSAFLSSTANLHLMKPIDGGELRRCVAELQQVRAAEARLASRRRSPTPRLDRHTPPPA